MTRKGKDQINCPVNFPAGSGFRGLKEESDYAEGMPAISAWTNNKLLPEALGARRGAPRAIVLTMSAGRTMPHR